MKALIEFVIAHPHIQIHAKTIHSYFPLALVVYLDLSFLIMHHFLEHVLLLLPILT
jgi:hypothetical protein